MKQIKSLLLSILAIVFMTACTEKKSDNPFFVEWESPYQIPPFETITVDNYREGLIKGMEEHNKEIDAIINNKETPDFQNTIVAFDNSGSLLSSVSRVFGAEVGFNGTDELTELRDEFSPIQTKHSNNITMNAKLFEKIVYVKENTDISTLSDEDAKLLEETYKSFVRNGALLTGEKAEELKKINEELSVLENKFSQNILRETASYQLIIEDEKDLAGLSDDFILASANRAEKAGMPGKWLFGLDNPSIMPFLHFNENKALRKNILTAYLNRGNNDNEFDNKEIVKTIVVLRKRKAELLGHENFAQFALEERMAKNSENVYALLNQLWIPSLAKANEELREMQKIAGNKKEETITDSDWRFYSEKLKNQKYNLSEEELRPYFKSENVRDGIFWLSNQLFGITFKKVDISKPHSDSEAFICFDKDGKTELGVLYIDLYARPGLKNGGAWCGSYRTARRDAKGERVLPITYIVCNFTPPLGEEPALFTPTEVETFFHEFGHALHNLFKDVKYLRTGGVPRDFVELPSQIMEHWAFEPEVLSNYARHYKTNEVIPTELVEKMEAASKFGQGFATTEYLAASLLDMDYHINANPSEIDDVPYFEKVTLSKRGLINQIPPRYRSTYFRHTFSGGYSAGYYSYIWSEVLDSDAYQAFVESGDIFNKDVAEKLRKHILAPGGIYPADKMYENFRGKQADIKHLLINRGLN